MSPEAFLQKFYSFNRNKPTEYTFKKNSYLSVAGEIENSLYFITNGAVRAIYVSENEEFTVRFGYKNSIIASLDSFVSNLPSQFYIQALRKTTVLIINRHEYFQFVHSSKENLEIHSNLMGDLLVSMLDREIDLLTSSPHERFNRLIKRSPQVFQEIPLKYIASYLRMTPETLSRLRNIDFNQE